MRGALVTAALVAAAAPLAAQRPEPPSTGGLSAFVREGRMLGHNIRVLVIGAHPDDEDTELIATLVRGYGAEVAYLSLNRGEGGQNVIGPELGEALGLIRSGELLAARQLDGARQYFSRAYDFGYSKNLQDTWAHWPQDSILKDVVRIVRRFRPQIIVSIFSGEARDGHGQHQAAGWAAREAFAIAGDASRFPELEREEGLAAWKPVKLYRSTRFDTGSTTMTLDGGQLDPVSGRSFHQIAMASRSLHRSQDMGQLQAIGPSPIPVALLIAPPGAPDSFLGGVDTTLTPLLGAAAGAYVDLIDSLRGAPGAGSDAQYRRAAAILDAAGNGLELRDQLRHLASAWVAARGIAVDALIDDSGLAPGDSATLTTVVAADSSGRRVRIEAVLADGLTAAPASVSLEAGPGTLADRRILLTVSGAATPTTPYYLRLPRAGDMYTWPPGSESIWGNPFEPDPVRVVYTFPDVDLSLHRDASHRELDQVQGEVRRSVTMVPPVSVRVDRDTVLISSLTPPASLPLIVTLTNGEKRAQRGQLDIELPAGWAEVAPIAFSFEHENEQQTHVIQVPVPRQLSPGTYHIGAVATMNGRRYDDGQQLVTYPHVRPRLRQQPARVTVISAPVALPTATRIGYIRGASDRIPESLAPAGFPVTVLDSAALDHGDLGRFDVIVVGPRAYEIDSALVAHNSRLLAFVREGGLLVVQYQQYQFVNGDFAPHPLTIRSPHDRVTDERAAVAMLDPGNPALTSPNRIGAADWAGWVQERGLYFAGTWDDAYVAPLAMHDPGEDPKRGGLLIARYGRGTYVYTGLAFFRELPAGVPGAFRLFANLLSLPRAPQP